MVRIQNTVDKSVNNFPVTPMTINATTSTLILPDFRNQRGEWAGRYFQNVGTNDLYFNYDEDCDATTKFAGKLAPYQQQDVSNFPGKVYVYSPAGTVVSFIVLIRGDNTTFQQWAKGSMNVP